MNLPLDFDCVVQIKRGHMRHGLYRVTSEYGEVGCYWFLHESPYERPIGDVCVDEDISNDKAHVAIKIEHPDQLRAIGDKMIRDADLMEKWMNENRKD